MKLPTDFVPEKDLEENMRNLLEGKLDGTDIVLYPNKIILKEISFDQAKEISHLESSINRVLVNFRYNSFNYKLFYDPQHGLRSSGAYPAMIALEQRTKMGLFKRLIRNEKCIKNLAKKLAEHFSAWSPVISSPQPLERTGNLAMCFYMDPLVDFPLTELDKFIQKGNIPILLGFPEYKKFKNVKVTAEYRNLRKDEAKGIILKTSVFASAEV